MPSKCKRNGDILRRNVSKLAPVEVFAEDKIIGEELRKARNLPDEICHAITLVKNAKPHLWSIKTRLGTTNEYYLKITTQVIEKALNKVITEVNQSQNITSTSEQKDNHTVCSMNVYAIRESVLAHALEAIRIMDIFDMEHDFLVNRYDTQRAAIIDMHARLRDYMMSTRPIAPSTN